MPPVAASCRHARLQIPATGLKYRADRTCSSFVIRFDAMRQADTPWPPHSRLCAAIRSGCVVLLLNGVQAPHLRPGMHIVGIEKLLTTQEKAPTLEASPTHDLCVVEVPFTRSPLPTSTRQSHKRSRCRLVCRTLKLAMSPSKALAGAFLQSGTLTQQEDLAGAKALMLAEAPVVRSARGGDGCIAWRRSMSHPWQFYAKVAALCFAVGHSNFA